MKRTIAIITILAVAVAAAPLMAQSGQAMRERVQAELERTDEILERARDAVRQTESSPAKLAYEQGFRIQEGAWTQFRGNAYAPAYKSTLQARERAQTALAAARNTMQNEDALLRRLERAEDLLQQARERLADSNGSGDALRAVYQSARENLDRAWEFYHGRQYRAALKLANQVERAARKLIASGSQQARADINYQRRAEIVHRFLTQAREMMGDCDSEAAYRLMEQARETYEMARRAHGESNHEAALQMLQNSHELSNQAMRECGGEQSIRARQSRFRTQADLLAEEIDPGDDLAHGLLAKVNEHLDTADAYARDGQIRAAVAALKAAELKLKELRRYVKNRS